MFENIVGNIKIKNELENLVIKNKVSHSYMFLGIQGIGKKMVAIEFAKMILCISENKYCNNCKSCIEFDSNNNPDFLIIKPDGNSIKIEQIREIQKKIQEKPIISDKKVYIIDDADFMTKEAQNCLLKTLEEPPSFATIILIGSNSNAFLPTIKSRCTAINFNRINDEEMIKYLGNSNSITSNMLQMFQGSIGKANILKEKQEEYIKLDKIISNIKQYDLIDFIKSAEFLYKSKDEINDILEYINVILLNKSKQEYLYTNCIKIVENTKKRLKQNANYDMSIDNMLFNMWEEVS